MEWPRAPVFQGGPKGSHLNWPRCGEWSLKAVRLRSPFSLALSTLSHRHLTPTSLPLNHGRLLASLSDTEMCLLLWTVLSLVSIRSATRTTITVTKDLGTSSITNTNINASCLEFVCMMLATAVGKWVSEDQRHRLVLIHKDSHQILRCMLTQLTPH